MLDAHQLFILAEVARCGSYTAAAKALGYSQPAISYQMRLLERATRAPLVMRAGRGIVLTEVGRRLADHADIVRAALVAAESEIRELSEQRADTVRLGAFQSSCATLVPALLDRLARTAPDDGARPAPQLVVHQVEPPEAAQLLRSGKIDVGLLCDWTNEGTADAERGLRRVSLMTDRRCVVVPADHWLARGTSDTDEVDFADLADEPWVMETVRDRFLAACAGARFTPRLVATADDHVTIQNLVTSGVGITLMNELAISAHLDSRLRVRQLANWPQRRIYALVSPEVLREAPVAHTLRELRSTARTLRRRWRSLPVGTGRPGGQAA
ncbi:LysR family transcriptional regulator [Micromonospora sp. NPDC023814]|uniref:LysR family transcriptional regulator n=1 Tax=Micromonospora sp. NPDC023814 TaxID=3154596 RepID=UPI00340B842F